MQYLAIEPELNALDRSGFPYIFLFRYWQKGRTEPFCRLQRAEVEQNKEKNMKAIVDKNTCTGCGLCVDTCPQVFEMGDDVAKVLVAQVPAAAVASCKEAAADCPVEAITIE